MLTTGIDGLSTMTGTAGNDTYTAVVSDSATTTTWTALDSLDGGAGTDTLNISSTKAAQPAEDTTANTAELINLSLGTIANIETMNIQAVGEIASVYSDGTGATDATYTALDTSNVSGLTKLNTTKSTLVSLKAATTTDVNVSGASGVISVVGGKDVAVTDATTDKAITVGNGAAGGDAAGKITITDTNNTGTAAITTEGGTDVTVTTTADKANSGNIVVGHATNGQASGAVVVTQNSTSNGTAMTAGNVTVTGGSTVNITANMTNTAVKAGAAGNITAGTFTVVAGNTTTDVTVKQVATATDFANDASAGTAEVSTVTFAALAAGEKAIISAGALSGAGTDLTFTAAKALTAAEVAAAFANLTAADIQACGGKVANGTFSGALDAGWTSGAASGANVTFTATAVGNQAAEITVSAKLADGTTNTANVADFKIASKTDGTAAGASTAVDVTADFGAVVIDDNATASIKTVTLDGYDTATIGNTTALTALTTVSLSNSSGANIIDNGATATALTLNLNKITGATDIDNGAASVTDLTVNTSGSASATALTAASLKNLTVNAAANLTITPTSIAALETLTVTGAGNVTMGDISAATTTITAGTATGAISATVDGTKATVTTGSGADSISVDTTTLTKNINLGAGDDTLTLSNAGTSVLATGTVTGGEGTDTLAMNHATAASLDANTNVQTAYTSFERLKITDASGAQIEADMLGFNYVTYAAAATSTLNNLANNGTVVFEAATNNATIAIKDAATGTADVANVQLDNKVANVTATKAVYTLNLTGLVSDDASDTIEIGGVTVLTGIYNATSAAAALNGTTVKISGVVYDVVDAGSDTITLTAQTFADVTASIAVTSTNNGATAGNANATAGATAPTTNGNDGVEARDFGDVTIANVETVNLNTNDLTTSVVSTVDTNTLGVTAAAAKTINITGNSNLTLDALTAAAQVTINATAMTGKLTYTANIASSTVNTGAGADAITLSANGITVNTGAGNDTITITDNVDLLKIYGGAGSDTFDFNGASSNKSNYAVIQDAATGDKIDLAGVYNMTGFASTAITLAQGATESTQAYLDQAIATLTQGQVGWFQYNGNTFVVADVSNSTTSFTDGADFVTMLVGTIDLSTASYNQTNGTLEIA